MKPALVITLLLALLQPGIAPASMTPGPGPDHAAAADCPHTAEAPTGGVCDHNGCQCEHACSTAGSRPAETPGMAAPRPIQASMLVAVPLTGFARTPFRPPSS